LVFEDYLSTTTNLRFIRMILEIFEEKIPQSTNKHSLTIYNL